jgi:ABC-type Na+ transport system ATPase subunit NatA
MKSKSKMILFSTRIFTDIKTHNDQIVLLLKTGLMHGSVHSILNSYN